MPGFSVVKDVSISNTFSLSVALPVYARPVANTYVPFILSINGVNQTAEAIIQSSGVIQFRRVPIVNFTTGDTVGVPTGGVPFTFYVNNS
jgi:hypothetical protein